MKHLLLKAEKEADAYITAQKDNIALTLREKYSLMGYLTKLTRELDTEIQQLRQKREHLEMISIVIYSHSLGDIRVFTCHPNQIAIENGLHVIKNCRMETENSTYNNVFARFHERNVIDIIKPALYETRD